MDLSSSRIPVAIGVAVSVGLGIFVCLLIDRPVRSFPSNSNLGRLKVRFKMKTRNNFRLIQ